MVVECQHVGHGRERPLLSCHSLFLRLVTQASIYAVSPLPQAVQKKREYM